MKADQFDERGASFFQKLPWAKILTWSIFLGLVYILQSFFAVIFLTFVISYIAHNAVSAVTRPFGSLRPVRKAAVIVTFVLFVFLVFTCGRFIVPNIYRQARGVYLTLTDISLHGSDNVENLIPRVYSGIRYLLFKTSSQHDEEFTEFKETRLAELNKSGWQYFRKEASKLRSSFHDHLIQQEGNAVVGQREGTEDYQAAFEAYLVSAVEREEYLPHKEKLEQGKKMELIQELTPQGYENLKTREADWEAYLKGEILEDLVRAVKKSYREFYYENLFRMAEVEREGEARVAEIEGTDERRQLFKDYYEGLPPTQKDFPYEDFVTLEKARSQKEYLEIAGKSDFSEEKLLDTFRKQKERSFAAELENYGFATSLNQTSLQDLLPGLMRFLVDALNYTFTFGFYLVLSVFFSFIIVWDIPKLAKTVRLLENSRVRNIYREITPSLVSFGTLMGRAFQAQAVIAVINTMLTLAALAILEVENRAFLGTIVFICSFIPVAGVIMSSIPIALMGLQQPGGGVVLALELMAAVVVIHFIEVTILNPKVMGDMLKLHPLLVLTILVVGEHFFGVWGLLLGVPVCVYIFRHVILKKEVVPVVAREISKKQKDRKK